MRMEEKAETNGTLLPPGHRLDLFVTLTDYRGHRHRILLHDPPSVDETEHRRIVSLHLPARPVGRDRQRVHRGDEPSLVFSARATASFPGAFPPATIAEMDRHPGGAQPRLAVAPELHRDKLMVGDPHGGHAGSYFIDGSVVMNKPFSPVIQALGNRPASREVVRRIIYVDPNPHREANQRGDQGTPGFFRTILTAMALIPRNEPIADDLLAIQEWNERARRMAEILAAADPAGRKAGGRDRRCRSGESAHHRRGQPLSQRRQREDPCRRRLRLSQLSDAEAAAPDRPAVGIDRDAGAPRAARRADAAQVGLLLDRMDRAARR